MIVHASQSILKKVRKSVESAVSNASSAQNLLKNAYHVKNSALELICQQLILNAPVGKDILKKMNHHVFHAA